MNMKLKLRPLAFVTRTDPEAPTRSSRTSIFPWNQARCMPSWGRRGVGKSTLLRLVAGLDQPLRGNVTLIGQRVPRTPWRLCFQDPALIPWWSVGRNVGIGVEFSDDRAGLYSKIKTFSLDRVGLSGLANRLPGTLSGGPANSGCDCTSHGVRRRRDVAGRTLREH